MAMENVGVAFEPQSYRNRAEESQLSDSPSPSQHSSLARVGAGRGIFFEYLSNAALRTQAFQSNLHDISQLRGLSGQIALAG